MQLKEGANLQGGKYRIVRVLGQGGFGITYLAENALLEKRVAIKEFFPKDFCGRDATSHLTLGTQNNAETVARLKERFVKEAKNIAKLDHPGIVRIHDIFEENNTAYYVMDYIEGESLADIVKRSGPLPETKAVEYITKVGEALEYIHSRQMTHFDVKPANIMVRRSDDQPILIDFGLSKQYDTHGEATSTLMQAVSHGYSPIEFYNLGSVTTFSPQTDVYSLGATLYYLLTGIVPPNASDLVEDRLSFPAGFPQYLKDAIEKAMSVGRKQRPESVGSFIHQLTNVNISEETQIISAAPVPSVQAIPPAPRKQKSKTQEENAAPQRQEPQRSSIKAIKILGGMFAVIVCIVLIVLFYPDDVYPDDAVESSPAIELVESIETYSSMVADSSVEKENNIKTIPFAKDKKIQTTLGNATYTGELDEYGLPHGRGIATWENGDAMKYNGDWKHGNMDGYTTYTLRSGDTFIGTFKDNHYEKGRYNIREDGSFFEGSFKNGQPDKGSWFDKSGKVID